jgi:hypothetical protein
VVGRGTRIGELMGGISAILGGRSPDLFASLSLFSGKLCPGLRNVHPHQMPKAPSPEDSKGRCVTIMPNERRVPRNELVNFRSS